MTQQFHTWGLGTYPRELKAETQLFVTGMSLTALCIIAKGWKAPTCPSPDERAMEHYSPLTGRGLTHSTGWRNPEDLMLSGRSQSPDEMSTRGQATEAEPRGRGRRGAGSSCLIGMGFPFGVVEMSWNYTEAMPVQGCDGAECHKSPTEKWIILTRRGGSRL